MLGLIVFLHGRLGSASLLRKPSTRIYLVDVLQCDHCGGRMKILAAIRPPTATVRILECLGLPSRAPPLAPASSDYDCQTDAF